MGVQCLAPTERIACNCKFCLRKRGFGCCRAGKIKVAAAADIAVHAKIGGGVVQLRLEAVLPECGEHILAQHELDPEWRLYEAHVLA